MSKHTDAADAIRRMAKQYEQMVTAAEILDQIGSLDNAAVESQAALTALRASVAAENAALAKAKDGVKAATTKAQTIQADANDKAEKTVLEAQIKADILLSGANEQAKAVSDKANAEVNAYLAESTKRADAIAKMIIERQAAVDAVNAQAVDAEDRLAKAEKQLAGIKAKLSSLVG